MLCWALKPDWSFGEVKGAVDDSPAWMRMRSATMDEPRMGGDRK